MQNLSNVEKSIFLPRTYVIYDGDGRVWYAVQIHDRSWSGRPGPSHPDRALKHRTADTLTALASTIGSMKRAPAVENV